ncbi:MAG: tyrosine-protein phosphatase [Candidatus Dormiibacterota bacterium]
MAITTRRLDWPDCRNARDLGGLPRPGGLTRSRVAIRSDNIASLTAAGRQAMIDYGVTTVIDLRSEEEVRGGPVGPPFSDFQSTSLVPLDASGSKSVRGRGEPTYRNLPLVDDSTAEVLNEAPTMPERYRLMIDRRQAAIGAIFQAIVQAEGPVLFHCFAGKDRTGLIAAMMLSLADVESEAIGADYAETDTQLATRYEEWLARAKPERLESMREELRCPPDWMLSTLAYIDQRWGGVAEYLEAAGMAPADIDRLTAKLA